MQNNNLDLSSNFTTDFVDNYFGIIADSIASNLALLELSLSLRCSKIPREKLSPMIDKLVNTLDKELSGYKLELKKCLE